MNKVLVLSYWNLNNPSGGGVRRIHALLDTLGKHALVCQPGGPMEAYETVSFNCDFGRRKLGINWGMFNFFWPPTARLVRRLVEERKPQLVLLTATWGYHPLRSFGSIPIVLDAHDVSAVAIGERFGRKHPITLFMRAWERKVVSRADHIFACSSIDREGFLRLYGIPADRVSVVPNGVTLREFEADASAAGIRPGLEEKLRGATMLFFMGSLRYQPNEEALRFLNGVLMPELERRRPRAFRLLVCGGPAPSWSPHPSLIFAGRVPDSELRCLMRRADICLAPIMTGSGTRLKILEYLAAGRPAISTAKGAEGIDYMPGRELLIAEPAGFCDAVLALASDRSKAEAIGQAGRRLVQARYDWDSSIKPLWRSVLSRWMDLE